jgi:sialidase-1
MTYSDDGGGTWTRPHFAETLLDPICMGSMVANSNGKPFLLFTNPNNLERADGRIRPGVGRDRKNLTVRVSYDGGMSWPVSRTLEAGSSAYSDLAVLPDGTIVCLYERGSTPAGGSTKSIDYAFLTVARFNLDWVTGGIDGARSD